MQGNQAVIDQLNAALKEELTAICQYILHSEMQHNWGYNGLSGFIKKQAIDEMRHAEGLIERILYLEGTPHLDVLPAPQVGVDVKAQLESDLAGEMKAVKMYNAAVRICSDAGDNGSRALFEQMVKDEEEHTDWLEAQLGMIAAMGYQNYLAEQMKGGH
jgi:bacterioferritin